MKRYNIINNTLGWLCFVVSAVTYLLTIEPTASFWDCPEFISQGAKLDVGHPPGNPIFMLTARFFVTIFGGDITKASVAVNSMSALLSAATILLLFWTITHLARKIIMRDNAQQATIPQLITIMGAGLCGALAYTWSDTFWFSAVEGEVYAFSSFCTALVFWLILKWENRADSPSSDRYLVLIAYVIGVSIAVHLLNLLCIPAIVLVFYYRKYADPNVKGSLISLLISFVIVGLILFGLVPGFVKVAQGFELVFVNSFGMSYNSGALIYTILLIAVFAFTIRQLYTGKSPLLIKAGMLLVCVLSGLTLITDSVLIWFVLIIALAVYLFGFCKVIPRRIFTLVALSILVIFIGYSSYALLLIRASANPPMNQNAPDNVFVLASYLNREQYGKSPLLYGKVFAEEPVIKNAPTTDGSTVQVVLLDDHGNVETKPFDSMYYDEDGNVIDNGKPGYAKVAKTSPDQPDKYVEELYTPDYATAPDLKMLFTRMHSTDPSHVSGYKNWSGYSNPDVENLSLRIPANIWEQYKSIGCIPLNEYLQYMNNAQGVRITKNSIQPDKYVWKPSFIDNLRYFLNYQLNHMYWRYFMWNFAGRQNDIQGNGEPHLGNWISGIPFIDNARLGDQSQLPDEFGAGNKGHNVFYMLPLLLGLLGLLWQSLFPHRNNPRRGIEQFWVVFFLFFMTGIAIVLYLNQTPGQPRERDYAFAGSFYAFAIWIGLGVPAIAQFIDLAFARIKPAKTANNDTKDQNNDKKEVAATYAEPDHSVKMASAVVAAVIGLLVPLQMVSQTWDDHDRSHRYAARDFGMNYLNSLDDNAIIFTNGDNDTFPLWYAQEVEGVRTDVRVVNLSYLSTDWYAIQQQHPYYDAKAVKMSARPTDYAYESLSYVRCGDKLTDTVPVLEALKKLYDAEPLKAYGGGTVKILETPNMYAPVDRAKAMKAFGINANSPDSVNLVPYISDIMLNNFVGAGGILQNNLLTIDIVGNSVADNFERPVYFAMTVPDNYYIGLRPYMHSSGMAYQVTPFKNPRVSPLAEKAYENIMSRYRWGGLDDPKHNKGLYLDETVRRMVTTVRSSMVDNAADLFDAGELPASAFAVEWATKNGKPVPANRYDMSRSVLHLLEEKLPAEAMPYDGSIALEMAALYIKLYDKTGNPDDLVRAQAIIDAGIERYAQTTRYALSLDPWNRSNLGHTRVVARHFAPIFIGFSELIDLRKKLAENPDKNQEALQNFDRFLDSTFYNSMYGNVFLRNTKAEDLLKLAVELDKENDPTSEIYALAALLVKTYDENGIDRHKGTAQKLQKQGITIEEILSL